MGEAVNRMLMFVSLNRRLLEMSQLLRLPSSPTTFDIFGDEAESSIFRREFERHTHTKKKGGTNGVMVNALV